jgi:hypothetical protein
MTNIINLTPHEITIYDQTGQEIVLRIPPSGKVARVSISAQTVGEINGVAVRKTTYGDVQDLPDPQPDTVYIVSTIVLIALQSKGITRTDVVSPDTSPDSAVRDSQGKILGVKYFQTI